MPEALVLEDIIISQTDIRGDLYHETKIVTGNPFILDIAEKNNWKLEIEILTDQGVNLEKDEIEWIFLIPGYEWDD